jgi:hypothetical protein
VDNYRGNTEKLMSKIERKSKYLDELAVRNFNENKKFI